MRSEISPDDLHVLIREADRAARRFLWKSALPRADLDDIRQELLVDLIARLPGFDRDRGTAAFWVRMPDGVHETSAGIAMLGDYVPAGFRLVLSETEKPASSLDNTVRITGLEPSEWLLLDIRLGTVTDGAAHGDLRAWTQSGLLVGMASQSFMFSV